MFTVTCYKDNTLLFSWSSTKLFLAFHCLASVIKINTASSCKVHGDLGRHACLCVTLADKEMAFSFFTPNFQNYIYFDRKFYWKPVSYKTLKTSKQTLDNTDGVQMVVYKYV